MNQLLNQPRTGAVFTVPIQPCGDPTYVCLGAFGDICNMLPLFYQEFLRLKKPISVVVSKTYAPIFEGTSYIIPIVWEGEYQKVNDAVNFVRERVGISNVRFINPTFHMVMTVSNQMRHKTVSFVREMWDLAGRGDEWGRHPLIFDRRDPQRESELVAKHIRPGVQTILVGATGFTSPFGGRDSLFECVRKEFPDCNVVDLAGIKCERIYDLVGLYDAADALISVDTVHLHLSLASKVPLLALVNDRPDAWRGSAFHPRAAFHCRYSDFERRKPEFVVALRNVMWKVRPPKVHTISNIMPGGYNPSIIQNGDGFLMAYRYHMGGNGISRIAFSELDSNFNVTANFIAKLPPGLERLSVEDPRLFLLRGRPRISFTVATWPMRPPFRCVVQIADFEKVENQYRIFNNVQPKYGKNDFSGMEKNFVCFDYDSRLFVIYGGNPQTVIEIENETVVNEYKTPIPAGWNYGTPRGGTSPLPWQGKLLRFFHSRTDESAKPNWWHYRIGVCLMEPKPPFAITDIREQPVISGDEEYFKSPLWKPKVAICYGCVKKDGRFFLSYGKNDSQCRIVEIEVEQFTYKSAT